MQQPNDQTFYLQTKPWPYIPSLRLANQSSSLLSKGQPPNRKNQSPKRKQFHKHWGRESAAIEHKEEESGKEERQHAEQQRPGPIS